jgi:FixJ family two-component response regulator
MSVTEFYKNETSSTDDVAAASDSPSVLIVDDDTQVLSALSATIKTFNSHCYIATSSQEAISRLNRSQDIGIIITDIYMGNDNGIALIENIIQKFGDRPLSFIVSSGIATIDNAIRAMRCDAIDFLPKPVSIAELRNALERAEQHWQAAKQLHAAEQLTELPDILSRLDAIAQSVEISASKLRHSFQKPWTFELLSNTIEKKIEARMARKRFFPGVELSDPNWDIILDVALGQLTKKPVPVSNACLAAGVSMTTALRCVRELVAQGWLVRWTDPNDRRRDLLGVTKMAMDSLKDYFETIGK